MLGSKIIIDNKNVDSNTLGFRNFRSWKILKNEKLWVQNLFEPDKSGYLQKKASSRKATRKKASNRKASIKKGLQIKMPPHYYSINLLFCVNFVKNIFIFDQKML